MVRTRWPPLIGLLMLAVAHPAGAAGDPEAGAQAFRACAACHTLDPGAHRTGPSLAGVFDRKALAQRAAPHPDLAVPVGVLPIDERDPDLGPVEQAGADLVLHDPALGEHADQVEVVDREPGIAPDRRAREAGIGPVDLAPEDDVTVVIGEEELLAVLARDPPERRKARRLRVEMRPHGRRDDLGHGESQRLEGVEPGRRQVLSSMTLICCQARSR
jgi:hypothetical protein